MLRRAPPDSVALGLLLAALLGSTAGGARADDLFADERRCTFRVPMKDGSVVLADEEPVKAFGKLVFKRDGRATSVPLAATQLEGVEESWTTCTQWRSLDSVPLRGTKLAGWERFAPKEWRGDAEYIYVYVMWGWCGPCAAALQKARDTLSTGSRLKFLLLCADDNPDIWRRMNAKHGFEDGPRWRTVLLDRESFASLSAEAHRGSFVAKSMLTTSDGCIVHWDLFPGVSTEILRRSIAAKEGCPSPSGGK